MKKQKWITPVLVLNIFALLLLLTACSAPDGSTNGSTQENRIKIGVVLTEVGLGDRSFNDSAFDGLIQERNEGNIVFDYKEPGNGLTPEQAFEQFAQEKMDLIIALTDTVKADLEKVAGKYPDQTFLMLDGDSELPNINSIKFKAEEGSYLAGMIAGFATKDNQIGFLGGMDIPVLHDFQEGFEQGVHAVNPDARVHAVYAGDFGKPELGAQLASQMMQDQGTDVIYVAAGLTGVGALTEIQQAGKHAIGVDTDQFFLAEKAILTSMLKNVDVSIRNAIATYKENNNTFPQKVMVYGLAENGIGITALHNITLSDEQQKQFEDQKAKIASGETKITLSP